MLRKVLGPVFLMVFLLVTSVSGASAAELDQAYVSAVGWGTIVASGNGLPAKDRYNPGQLDFRDGKFFISQGSTIDLRVLNRGGLIYSQLLDETNSANENKRNNILADNICYLTVWVSHDVSGYQEYKKWPASLSELPDWNPYGEIMLTLQGNFFGFNTIGYGWKDEILGQIPGLANWMQAAKPGYQLYIMSRVGFKRDAPESKSWDANKLQYVTPWEYVRSEPVAACTVVIK